MNRNIAFFMMDLDGGGIQKVFLQIAQALHARGYPIDLIVCQAIGPISKRIPPEINLIELSRTGNLRTRIAALQADSTGFLGLLRPVLASRKLAAALEYMPSLADYIRKQAPDALPPLSDLEHAVRRVKALFQGETRQTNEPVKQ